MASLDEIVVQLFEAMFELHFLDNSVSGARFCLDLALEKFPSQVAYAHLFDINTREFVVVSTHGAGTASMIGKRHPGYDPMLAAAMREQNAVIFNGEERTPSQTRYNAVSGLASVVVAPVMDGGRFLGALELVNPECGEPFADREKNALTYIAQRFAEFVATRGVVVDAEKIIELVTRG